MKFCRNCGAQIDDNAIFCHNCGSRTNGDAPNNPYGFDPYGGAFCGIDMRESWPIKILSFLFWQAGLILWFFWRNTRPGKARSALKGTLSAACFQFPIAGLVLWFLWRGDLENKIYAKIGAISAIVGISLNLLAYLALWLLAASGNLTLPEIGQEIFGGTNALFAYLSRF